MLKRKIFLVMNTKMKYKDILMLRLSIFVIKVLIVFGFVRTAYNLTRSTYGKYFGKM